MFQIQKTFTKPKIELFFSIFFVIIIILPIWQQYTHCFHYEKLEEKKEKIPFPKLNISTLRDGSYTKSVEVYYTDNFGFRDLLIQANNTLNFKIFNKTETPKLIVGKDNWFFYYQDQKDYEKKAVSAAEMKEMIRKLDLFAADLNKQGIELVFIICPNKATLYPEYMPDSIPKPKEGNQSNLEIFDSILKKDQLIHYIDMRSTLIEKKKDYLVYPKVDSHWTEVGTYFVAQDILTLLSQTTDTQIKMPKVNLAKVELYDQIMSAEGDLKSLLGIWGVESKKEVQFPKIEIPSNTEKFPKILWYGTSFSPKLEKYITPYTTDITYFHFQREPMKNNLKTHLPGTKVVVFELVERWLTDLISYDFPKL